MIVLENTKEINSVDIKGYRVILEEVTKQDDILYVVSLKYPKGSAIIEDVQGFRDIGKAYQKAFNLVNLVVNWKVKL